MTINIYEDIYEERERERKRKRNREIEWTRGERGDGESERWERKLHLGLRIYHISEYWIYHIGKYWIYHIGEY